MTEVLFLVGSMILGAFLSYQLPIFTVIVDSVNPILFLISFPHSFGTGGALILLLASFLIALMTKQLKEYTIFVEEFILH